MLTAMLGYAATALGYLAENADRPVQVREIAGARAIPAPYLAKIVRTLSAKGVVSTQRGVGGGVTLLSDPKELTLFDLCEMLDEPLLVAQCMLGQESCSDDNACPAHEEMRKVRALQLAVLRRTTIAQIGRFDVQRTRPKAGAKRGRKREAPRH